jgi:hypothetical protein
MGFIGTPDEWVKEKPKDTAARGALCADKCACYALAA